MVEYDVVVRHLLTLAALSLGLASAAAVDCEANKKANPVIHIGLDGRYFAQDFDLAVPPVAANLAQIVQTVKLFNDRGIAVVVVPVPHSGIVNAAFLDRRDPLQKAYDPQLSRNAYTQLLQGLRAARVPVVDLLNVANKNSDFLFKSDWHWKPEAAQASANAVAQVIKDLPVYKSLEKKDFKTSVVGQAKIDKTNGFYLANLLKRCGGDDTTSEPYTIYKTSPVQDGGLLDDTAPSAVIAGTSYSAMPAWNFAGFLQQATSLDFVNNSVTAGGVFAGMMSLLNSEQLKSTKLVVWEFDLGRLQNSATSQGQWAGLMTQLTAKCEGPNTSINLSAPKTEIKVVNPGAIKLTFPDQVVNLFDVIGPDKKTTRVYRPTVPNPWTSFYVPASVAGTYILNFYHPASQPKSGGQLTVQECRV